jgi:hypothetical protein
MRQLYHGHESEVGEDEGRDESQSEQRSESRCLPYEGMLPLDCRQARRVKRVKRERPDRYAA